MTASPEFHCATNCGGGPDSPEGLEPLTQVSRGSNGGTWNKKKGADQDLWGKDTLRSPEACHTSSLRLCADRQLTYYSVFIMMKFSPVFTQINMQPSTLRPPPLIMHRPFFCLAAPCPSTIFYSSS